MEEMRSFGYICPSCGKAVLHSRSVFALNAAAARMECECGKEALCLPALFEPDHKDGRKQSRRSDL